MKNSIEKIWKDGFIDEKNLVIPKINNLYNQKSMLLVDKMKRMFKINLIVIIIASVLIPVFYYTIDAFWFGMAASLLLLFIGWFHKRQFENIKTIDQGANSLDYLKMFDRWLKDVLSKSERVARFAYPLFFIIAIGTIWAAWSKNEELAEEIQQKFPDLLFIGNVPLFALVIVVIITVLMFYFSDKIYRWDVRLVYGRIFNKLENTIAEMEELKQD